MSTLDFYDKNAQQFVSGTIAVDFSKTQKRFLSKLPKGCLILDFGCGSGRDTRYFLEEGYMVEATDGSSELCRMASEYTGIPVRQMLFQELDEKEKYDGIWACSSILHLDIQELEAVLQKMCLALKTNGIIYTSFKYGTFQGERNGRFFTDMTEETFATLLSKVDGLKLKEQWVTKDVRPGRAEEQWLNVILCKTI